MTDNREAGAYVTPAPSDCQPIEEAQNTAAMLTTFNEVDMSAVIELRAEYKEEFEKTHGARLGFMGFFRLLFLRCVNILR